MEKKNLPNIAIIDGDFLLYYCTYPKKVVQEETTVFINKSLKEVFESADSSISQILTATNSEHYIAYLTVGSFRYKIYQEYKANRKHREKPEHFRELVDYLIQAKGFRVYEELEADDCVNITRLSIKEYNPIMVSNDTDLLSLEGVHYNPIKKTFISCSSDQAHTKFWGDMIIGQPGDNIKGIPGKGKAFVEKLFSIQEVSAPYHQLVLSAFIAHFGEQRGIDEFYKNYKCLKILEDYPGFVIPEPVKLEASFPL